MGPIYKNYSMPQYVENFQEKNLSCCLKKEKARGNQISTACENMTGCAGIETKTVLKMAHQNSAPLKW
jgi:hypothetical protein